MKLAKINSLNRYGVFDRSDITLTRLEFLGASKVLFVCWFSKGICFVATNFMVSSLLTFIIIGKKIERRFSIF